MRKPLIHSTVLAAALACSSLVFAAAPPPATNASTGTTASHPWRHSMHHGRHRDHHAMRTLDKLNLTDAQRSSVHQLMQQSFEQARPAMQTLRQKRTAFENAAPGSSDYQTAANDLAQAESNAAHDRVLRQASLRAKIYNVLTPAQRTQLTGIRSQHEEKMKQRRESHTQRHSANTPAPSASAQ